MPSWSSPEARRVGECFLSSPGRPQRPSVRPGLGIGRGKADALLLRCSDSQKYFLRMKSCTPALLWGWLTLMWGCSGAPCEHSGQVARFLGPCGCPGLALSCPWVPRRLEPRESPGSLGDSVLFAARRQRSGLESGSSVPSSEPWCPTLEGWFPEGLDHVHCHVPKPRMVPDA